MVFFFHVLFCFVLFVTSEASVFFFFSARAKRVLVFCFLFFCFFLSS